jgi:hypothetical protein
MTTTTLSLVERVRDILDDYGDGSVALAAAISSTSATSFTVDSIEGVNKGTWLMADYEMVEVTATTEGPPATLTVRRGQRGTTATTHASGAILRVNPIVGDHAILNALNAGLSRLSKQVVDSATLAFADNDFDYAVPATIDVVYRAEAENSDEASQFNIFRDWEMLDHDTVRIYGGFTAGRNIRLVGTSKFTRLAAAGSLDTDFPDTNDSAINYLVASAIPSLLLQVQAAIAKRDSFKGMTDAFAASQPDQSARTSRYWQIEAERYLRDAIRQCPILQVPESYVPSPGRRYLARA